MRTRGRSIRGAREGCATTTAAAPSLSERAVEAPVRARHHRRREHVAHLDAHRLVRERIRACVGAIAHRDRGELLRRGSVAGHVHPHRQRVERGRGHPGEPFHLGVERHPVEHAHVVAPEMARHRLEAHHQHASRELAGDQRVRRADRHRAARAAALGPHRRAPARGRARPRPPGPVRAASEKTSLSVATTTASTSRASMPESSRAPSPASRTQSRHELPSRRRANRTAEPPRMKTSLNIGLRGIPNPEFDGRLTRQRRPGTRRVAHRATRAPPSGPARGLAA